MYFNLLACLMDLNITSVKWGKNCLIYKDLRECSYSVNCCFIISCRIQY